jgi:hypothetical protein
MHADSDRRVATPFREIILGVAILVLGAALLKFSDLPTRISVLETKEVNFDQRLQSMDGKLDTILWKIKR